MVALFVAAPASADSYRDAQWWLADYGVTRAWETATGKGITIAIIDTGVDGTVPDLTGQVVGGTDVSGIGAENGQTPLDPSKGHATQVASLAAGHGDGPNGVMGTAPDAKILSISSSFTSGVHTADEQVAAGVNWAVDHHADIIVMSFVMNRVGWTEEWDKAFLKAEKAGVLIVAAAGNRGSGTVSIGAPATIPGVLAVGGVTRAGTVSSFASTAGSTIAVVAASVKLPGATPGGGHVMWNGTSGAAPIVAGIAALVMQAHPELDTANIVNRIISTARPVGTPGNVDYGFGIIDAYAAVTADVPKVKTNPLGTLADWIPTHRYVDWRDTTVPIDRPTIAAPNTTANSEIQSAADNDKRLREIGIPSFVIGGLLASLGALVYGVLRRKPVTAIRPPAR